MNRKLFDCKKCPVLLASFVKHDGLFLSYIVHNIFFNSRMMVKPFIHVTWSKDKKVLTRKTWFKFLDVTESRNQWSKAPIFLVLSIHVWLQQTHIFTTFKVRRYVRRYVPSIDRLTIHLPSSTHTLYLIGAASRPTWSEPPFLRSVL